MMRAGRDYLTKGKRRPSPARDEQIRADRGDSTAQKSERHRKSSGNADNPTRSTPKSR